MFVVVCDTCILVILNLIRTLTLCSWSLCLASSSVAGRADRGREVFSLSSNQAKISRKSYLDYNKNIKYTLFSIFSIY